MSLEPFVSFARAVGLPIGAILVSAGVVIVHGWRLESKAEDVAAKAAKAEVEQVRTQLVAQATVQAAQASEVAALRGQVASVDAGVRAEVKLVREELSQMRVGQDRAREEDRKLMNTILLEVRKR